MKHLSQKFRKYLMHQNLSKTTVRIYEFVAGKFLLRVNPALCSYFDIISYLKEFCTLRYKQLVLAGLKQLFIFLVEEEGLRIDNPCCRIVIRSNFCKDVLPAQLLNGEELDTLHERQGRYGMLEVRDRVILSLLITQGLTAIELSQVRIEHVDLRTRQIIILQSRKYLRRKLALLNGQTEMLRNYIDFYRPQLLRIPNNRLLLGKNGTEMGADNIQYLVSTLKHLVPGKELCPQLIRRSVIARWINEFKIPPEQVQLMCGHRWLSSTMRYQFGDMKKDVKLINKWLG